MKTDVSSFVKMAHNKGKITISEDMQIQNLRSVDVMDNPAKVKVTMGHTKNLGNFESLRIEVGIEVPCDNEKEVIEATYESAFKWVDDKVAEKITEFLGK